MIVKYWQLAWQDKIGSSDPDVNLTRRPAHRGGSFEFAWKIVLAFPTYDMFSYLILFSLLAALLTQISGFQYGTWFGTSGAQRVLNCIARSIAGICQQAICRAECLMAAVYKAGAPPGLPCATPDQVLQISRQYSEPALSAAV